MANYFLKFEENFKFMSNVQQFLVILMIENVRTENQRSLFFVNIPFFPTPHTSLDPSEIIITYLIRNLINMRKTMKLCLNVFQMLHWLV